MEKDVDPQAVRAVKPCDSEVAWTRMLLTGPRLNSTDCKLRANVHVSQNASKKHHLTIAKSWRDTAVPQARAARPFT